MLRPFMTNTDRALMLLPFEEWISIGTAARRAKIDKGAALNVVRAGRRRGVLCTRGKGTAQQVMRIHPDPYPLLRPRRDFIARPGPLDFSRV